MESPFIRSRERDLSNSSFVTKWRQVMKSVAKRS